MLGVFFIDSFSSFLCLLCRARVDLLLSALTGVDDLVLGADKGKALRNLLHNMFTSC